VSPTWPSALGQFPVIGRQLQSHSLRGRGLALGLGIAAALCAGMGVFLASQKAMNHVCGVPYTRRPYVFRARLTALGLLVVLGGGFVRDHCARGARVVRRRFRRCVEDRLDRAFDGAQLRALLSRLSSADGARGDVEAAPRRRDRRVRRAAGARRLVRRPRGAGRDADLRHVRARERAPLVGLSRGAHHAAGGGDECRRDAAACGRGASRSSSSNRRPTPTARPSRNARRSNAAATRRSSRPRPRTRLPASEPSSEGPQRQPLSLALSQPQRMALIPVCEKSAPKSRRGQFLGVLVGTVIEWVEYGDAICRMVTST
jgi:hypothetical protein